MDDSSRSIPFLLWLVADMEGKSGSVPSISSLSTRAVLGAKFISRVIALACCVFVFVGCTEEPLGEGQYRWEGTGGFAIWPEDQPEDGLVACTQGHHDSWRRDPGAAAEEFVRTVLDWNEPPDHLSRHEVPEDAPRAVFSIQDGSMHRSSLGVVVHLRQLRGCWFVAAVWPREGDGGGDYDWIKKDGQWVLHASWDGREPINLEVGWGDTIERVVLERGDEIDLAIPDPEMSGHILWFYDEPSDHTFGQPLSPPPRIP